jgi:hypothetical protein
MKILPTIIERLFNDDILIKNEICPLCTGNLIESTYLTDQCGSCHTKDRPFSLGTSTEPCYCEEFREKCLECPQCYDKIYLFVPFKEKDTAKELGCEWDSDKKKWYFPYIEYIWKSQENACQLLKKFGSPRVQMLLNKTY